MNTALSITTNVKAIDSLKSEILCEVSNLYRKMADYDSGEIYENVSGSIATIIAMDYILARRIGLDFKDVDEKIAQFASMAAESGHELEAAFGDMTGLKKHIKRR